MTNGLVARVTAALFTLQCLACVLPGLAGGAPREEWESVVQQSSYYSPLATINDTNVGSLGYAWQYDLGTHRGQEATPVVVGSTMYAVGLWGVVHAVNAATGAALWTYDPEVPGQVGRDPCCDIVNRGLSVARGRVYVASLDGRLHAIDARTGRRVWVTDTIIDHAYPYVSTGAPQIAHNVVVIGNSGGDMAVGGVRGYVSAYDLDSGALKWRFFTVPGEPGQQPESPDVAIAAKSWDSHRDPKFKLGGAAWDGFAYDPSTNLVYFGTGNAAPYDTRQLGPNGGDNLFTASVVALDADNGRMSWYFQETPDDRWDYDATQKLVTADITIDGQSRHVLMQASKNGFFYVWDARTGALVSAKDYVFVNWTDGLDAKTGRPHPVQTVDYEKVPRLVLPSEAGAHTWSPMAYNPHTGLVYVPTIDASNLLINMLRTEGSAKYINGSFTTGVTFTDDTYDPDSLKLLFGQLPSAEDIKTQLRGRRVREVLQAWNPVTQAPVWSVETSSGTRGFDGGVSSTGGNLVIQGRGNGELWVYAADSGKVLKVIQTGSHIMAAPMTYEVAGEQYVAVQVGYGGGAMTLAPIPESSAAHTYDNDNRILAFKLGGGPVPLPAVRTDPVFTQPPAAQPASAETLRLGELKFAEQCSRCHVFGPSVTPDLRKMSKETHEAFGDIVLRGRLAAFGMGRFDDLLNPADVDAIHDYLIEQQRAGYAAQSAPR